MVALLNFGLYAMQQVGVMLAVGAETLVLIGCVGALRAAARGEKKDAGHAGTWVVEIGLWLIIFSGAAITVLEFMSGQGEVVFAPAYLFKCVLIVALLLFSFFPEKISTAGALFEGLVGATWYALFAVHILAPMTTWNLLGSVYGVWLAVFMLLWAALVFSLKGAPAKITVSSSINKDRKVISVPRAPARIDIPLPQVAVSTATDPVAIPGGLPSMRLMPKNAQDLATQHRAPEVQYG